jgi:DNA (cytosine-5)-methyltransferase 1
MNFNEMTLKKLKEYCKNNNIKKYSRFAKKDLINLIESTLIESDLAENTLTESNFKFIDLFCGIGGFHQAMNKIDENSECILACDVDKNCRNTYFKNYNIMPEKNVKDVDEKILGDFDILCAGFPCQPFSNGGKKKSFDDARGLLFNEIIRIAKHKKPKFMFLENVKHILKVSNGEVIDYIKTKINETGYNLQLIKMSPHLYGIPQQRERIFFVCVRNDIYNNKEIDIVNKNLNLSFIDILDDDIEEKYKISDELNEVLEAWDELIKKFEVGERISPTFLVHDAYRDYTEEQFNSLAKWKKDYMTKNKKLLNKYPTIISEWYQKYKKILSKREIYGKLEWQVGLLKENDSIFNYFIQMRQSGIRVKKAKFFPTLVAISQIPIYGKEKRYITPRECARLQSYPEEFELEQNDKIPYKQMGNSVNVHNTYQVIYSTLKHYSEI